jgi:hypothetical protein
MELSEHLKPIATALLTRRLEGKSNFTDDLTLVKGMMGPTWDSYDTVELASWTFDVDHEHLADGMTVQEVAEKYGLTL